MPICKIEIFEMSTHYWEEYCRRMKQFIVLNSSMELHVVALVTHVGETCYELM